MIAPQRKKHSVAAAAASHFKFTGPLGQN